MLSMHKRTFTQCSDDAKYDRSIEHLICLYQFTAIDIPTCDTLLVAAYSPLKSIRSKRKGCKYLLLKACLCDIQFMDQRALSLRSIVLDSTVTRYKCLVF